MKAILEFELPEDQYDFDTASNGWKYRLVLCDIDDFLRNKLKYEELSPGEDGAYDKTRTELWNLINEHKIDIH
jgi:hypothetical protein